MVNDSNQSAQPVRRRTRAASLGDVAKLAGVSPATASRVLHGSGGRSPHRDLVERVVTAAEELNYVANVHAQLLARSARSGVGMIVHRINDPYFGAIAQGAIDEGAERDEIVTLCDARQNPALELKYIDMMIDHRVKVILLAGSGSTDPALEARVEARIRRFVENGGAVVSLTRRLFDVATSRPDNEGGGRIAAQHLYQLAHQRIGLISGPANLTTNEDRLNGFRTALREFDSSIYEQMCVNVGDFTRVSGYTAAQMMLSRSSPPTALFCANDLMALGALAAARDMGLDVPSDVSIVGFGDIPAVLDSFPTLTTVRSNLYEAGRRGVVVGLDTAANVRVDKIPCELIHRGSTAPASQE